MAGGGREEQAALSVDGAPSEGGAKHAASYTPNSSPERPWDPRQMRGRKDEREQLKWQQRSGISRPRELSSESPAQESLRNSRAMTG